MEKFYLTVTGIENLSPDDYVDRANDLVDLADSPTQEMRENYFPGFVSLIDRWMTAGENKMREPATAEIDKDKIKGVVGDLRRGKSTYIDSVGKSSKMTAPNNQRPDILKKENQADMGIRPEDEPKDEPKGEGDTFTVNKKPAGPKQPQTRMRPTADESEKLKQDLNNLSGQSSRTTKVKEAIEEGLALPDNEPFGRFIQTANLAEMNKELEEIKNALGLIDIAQRDLASVKPDLRADLNNQMKRLEDLQRNIMRSQRYKDLADRKDTDPVRNQGQDLPPLPPRDARPEKVEPQKPPTPKGTVREETPGFNQNDPMVLEAKEYVRKIKAVPSGQLPIQVNEILQILQEALNSKDMNRLREGLERARSYFSTVDADLNRVSDSKERQGRAIDQGLEDFKKIEAEKKQIKDSKPKLEDLRATAEQGEEERVKKNFNKDVLELTKANDVLKSQVNLQKEEIKVLKETLEQKLKKENEEMLKGVAPVFRSYLQLDIDNVFREDEIQEEVFYSVL